MARHCTAQHSLTACQDKAVAYSTQSERALQSHSQGLTVVRHHHGLRGLPRLGTHTLEQSSRRPRPPRQRRRRRASHQATPPPTSRTRCEPLARGPTFAMERIPGALALQPEVLVRRLRTAHGLAAGAVAGDEARGHAAEGAAVEVQRLARLSRALLARAGSM